MPLWVWWVGLMVIAWPPLAWFAIQARGRWTHRLATLTMLPLAAALPWMAPASSPGLRFVLLLPSLLMMVKTWEVVVNKPRKEAYFQDFPSVFWWSVLAPEGRWHSDAGQRREVRSRAARTGLSMVGKFLAFSLLLYLNGAVELHTHGPVSVIWMAFSLYLALGAGIEGYAFVSRLIGVDQPAFFNLPPLARNPRDFWGRRWNLWFTQTTHRLIFQPLGGVRRPLFAASGVFVFSAAMHEYMVLVSLERFDGRMTLFFLLHGLATILFTLFAKGPGQSMTIPRSVAVPIHFVWFVATAPLFFGPVDDIFALRTWVFRDLLLLVGLA